jgi:hypothetical protein
MNKKIRKKRQKGKEKRKNLLKQFSYRLSLPFIRALKDFPYSGRCLWSY